MVLITALLGLARPDCVKEELGKLHREVILHWGSLADDLFSLWDVWRVWASEFQFWATLGPKISKKKGIFSKHFPLVSHQSWFICQFHLLLVLCWISASEAQFLSHFGPQNRTWFRSLVIFSNIFHWFHILLVLHAYWGMFRCISRCSSTCSGACYAVRPLVIFLMSIWKAR